MISVSSFTSSCLFFWCCLCLSLLTQVEFFICLQMHLSDLLSRCESSFLYLLVSFLLKKKKTFNISFRIGFSSVQFSSVTQSCPTLCNPMNCSTPGLPVHHQLPPKACPSSRYCHLAISSSVVPFSSCPQSLLASESFPMSQLFA